MDGEMDRERIIQMRKMARKLAYNKSQQRVIRKLPRTIKVVKVQPKRVVHLRASLNNNKRLTYILLLGAVLCAYMYDIDQNQLEQMMQAVNQATTHLSFMRNT
jgi:hypothetical protein